MTAPNRQPAPKHRNLLEEMHLNQKCVTKIKMNYFNKNKDNYKIRFGYLNLIILTFSLATAMPLSAQEIDNSCLTIPFSSDSLIKVRKSDGEETVLGSIGVKRIQAIALNSNADTIYAARSGQLGIILLKSLKFKPLPKTFGTGNGSLGTIDFVEVEGLSFDIETTTLFGSVKVKEPSKDILIKIDPKTGAFIPDAFGAGVDYVTISGPGVLSIVEDIAVNPLNGEMFGLSRLESGGDLLIQINKDNGSSTVVGSAGIDLLEGLGFDNNGDLFATPGLKTTLPPRFFRMDLSTGNAITIGELSSSVDYESCDCLTAPVEPNTNPTALDDNYHTNINQRLTVEAPGILGNDTDPDGDALSVIAYDSTSSKGGTVDLNSDGSFTYTPAMDSMNIDTFTYIVSDGNGNTDTAMVSIIIKDPRVGGENSPPIAEDDEFMTDQDLELVVTDPDEGILINDSDPDGDNIAALEVTNAFTDQGGFISINANGTFSYTPSLGFVGVDTYEYTVCDDQDPQLCDNAIISIEVKELPVKVFDAFSPNGDGINDVWIIQGITRFPNNHVQIFNRWGNLVYQVRGYDNSANAWLGQSTEGITFGKNEVPDGGYFYVIDLGDGSERLSGFVVIRR